MADALHALFWSKVDKEAPGGCWLWGGQRWDDGGILKWRGELKRTRDFSWELHHGSAVTRVEATCGNGLCVNPAHLRLRGAPLSPENLEPPKRRGRPKKEVANAP